jgi:hypothetical protein
MRRPRLKFRRSRPIEPNMGLDVSPIGTPRLDAAPQRAPRDSRASAADGARDALELSGGEVPASPPAEVLDAIDAAGRVARELHAQGRELRFTPPAPGSGERVRIELRDLDGHVLRTIPPSELLDVATGGWAGSRD